MNGDMIVSLFIYFGALAITLFFCFIYEKSFLAKHKWSFANVIALLIICLPLSLLAGLRDGMGVDYYNYVRIFNTISNQTLTESLNFLTLEPLFIVIVKILSFISPNVHFLFFSLEMLTLYVAFRAFLRMHPQGGLCYFALFYYLILYHYSYNILRQVLAISFVLLALSYLLKKKVVKATFVLIVTSLIHYSSIIMLILLPIYLYANSDKTRSSLPKKKQRFRERTVILLMILSVAGISFFMDLLLKLPFLADYTRFMHSGDVVNLGFGVPVYAMITILPLFIFARTICNENEDLKMLRLLSILYLPMAFSGYYAEFASRLSLFTKILPALFVAHAINNTKKTISLNKLKFIYVVVFGFLYYHFFINLNYGNTYPYSFI